MSDNGSGVYVVNSAGQPVVSATPITAAAFNAFTADVATALSNRICKDGQSTPTANIPMGGYKITNLAAGTARTDAASLATIQDGTGVYVATVGGTATAITLTPSPAIAAYVAGQKFSFIPSAANTGATTVAISGLTAKNIFSGNAACVGGELTNEHIVVIQYDGTRFQLITKRQYSSGWTPQITAATPGDLSVSYTQNLGYMTMNGNMIVAWFDILTSAFTYTTASGVISITGLLLRGSSLMSPWFGGVVNFSGLTKSNYTQVIAAVPYTTTTITLYASGSAQANAQLAITDFPTGGTVRLQGCVTYLTDGG